ncbi:hypothetical protein EIMP300_32980 [Escherichia coli]|uniref:Tetratricopeptide repeat protein n=1 Tax=Escherichia coli TaxID=562 RepID=A0A8S0FP94_ECOLX|nr:hypothetical protein EIMP300_32980 [Escherichia coli]
MPSRSLSVSRIRWKKWRRWRVSKSEECWFARHLLACFYYNKRSYGKAIALWQRCVEMSPEFADGWRGLAIHAWNKQHDYELAARYLDNAYQLAPQDARLQFSNGICWIS